MRKLKIYLKAILLPLIVGGIVGLITYKYMDYEMLVKPFFSPPGIIFPIVWTILYTLMGISYGILKDKKIADINICRVYYLQLIVNALWSIIFFILKLRLLAYIWIILLAILVTIMIIEFYEKDKITGLLQIPYLLWIIFASYLNFSFYILNKNHP